jgi:DNA-binding NtrC family response regulator
MAMKVVDPSARTLDHVELAAWRAAAVATDLPALALRLGRDLAGTPAACLFLRALRTDPHRLETVAVVPLDGMGPTAPASPASPPLEARVLKKLLALGPSGIERLHVGKSAASASWAEGVVPQGLDAECAVGLLAGRDGPVGVAVLVARRGESLRPKAVDVLESLMGPLAFAVARDRAAHPASRAGRRGAQSGASEGAAIVGADSGLRDVMERVALVARTDTPVLILGETGSGKEVIARAVHAGSRRHGGPVMRVNCGAIPPDLVDSELFGHERGSFTGALSERKGWFERADGGTLFLDEVAELSLGAQVRLLRILQDGSYEKVGGHRTHSVDVRIVAATHRDLGLLVADGRFREDLYYRINVFPIVLPSLRDRREDIRDLAAHFALKACRRLGIPPLPVPVEDVEMLEAYDWPGNVRELGAVVERAAILGGGRHLDLRRAFEGVGAEQPGSSGRRPRPGGPQPLATLDEATRRHLEAVLKEKRGQIEGPAGAARALGINPHTLRARMRKLGVEWKRFRG